MSPYFHNFAEFIAMGGHGSYVWSTWLLTLLGIIALVFLVVVSVKPPTEISLPSRRANNSVISVRLRAADNSIYRPNRCYNRQVTLRVWFIKSEMKKSDE